MELEIIAQWDEIVGRQDLRGHRVKVIVMDATSLPQPTRDTWLDGLDRMVAGAVSTGNDVDTSRDRIYTGTIDDTR